MNKQNIIFFTPTFKQMVWGGNRLKTEYNYDIPGDQTGECWAVSANESGDSIISNGEFQGKTLSWLWKEHRELFGHVQYHIFPFLVKIIDAKEDLSLQVHPDDTYAYEKEKGAWGKTECWYVLDCPDNASIVLGHQAKTKEQLKEFIEQGKWEQFIREIPIKKGDFLQINPGTVHTIRGGTMVLEIQQNSNITYRVYDYNRKMDGVLRELHIEKSLEVITVPASSEQESMISQNEFKANCMNFLLESDYYKIWKLQVLDTVTLSQQNPFLIMSVMEGNGKIDGVSIKKGDHFMIPSHYGDFVIKGQMQIIVSSVN